MTSTQTGPKPRRVLIFQHAEPEHPGLITTALEAAEVAFDVIRTDLGGELPPCLDNVDGLIIMGGPQSAYEEERFPYLKGEKRLTREAMDGGKPVLGVCLGSQIIADVLGADVRPGGGMELGWRDVRRAPGVADDGVLSNLPDSFTPMHWHGDVFDLPPGATPIADSDMTRVQGFVYGSDVYALLFHLELTQQQIQAMAELFPDDLQRAGVDREPLLREMPARLEALQALALDVFTRWARLL